MAVAAKRWGLLATWLGALALLAGWNALTIRPGTDLSQFLPRAASQQDRVLLSQVSGGVAARTLLIRVGAADGDDDAGRLAAASRALAARLRDSGAFVQVANGNFAAAAAETDPVLFRHRYLIGPSEHCAGGLDEEHLRTALEQRLHELASGLAMLDKQRLAADPTACYRALLRTLAPEGPGPQRRHGVWLSRDGRYALLVAVTAAGVSDMAAQRSAVASIERTFAALPGSEALMLELAGPGYFAVSSEQLIKTETILLSTAASVIVALILALAFRSAALVLLGLLPLASGVLVGAALVSLLFGTVHGITLALGVTLLGVALDYPVHVYAHAAGAGAHRDRPVWRTMLLGMVTTVLGYAALAWTSFEGLSQLGILAAAGLAVAALTSRYLLPPLMPPGYRLPERRWLAQLQPRLPRLQLRAGVWLLLAALAGVGLALLHGDPWETDIRRLGVVPQQELDKDTAIRAQLGAPDVARLLYVVADGQGGVLEHLGSARPELEELKARSLISGFDSVERWLPSPAAQRARQQALPAPAALASALEAANTGLPFRLDRLQPFIDDVQASRTLTLLRAEGLDGTLAGTRTDMLIQPLGGRWLGLVSLSGVAGPDAVAALEDLAGRHGMAYLDLRQGTAELLDGFFAETLDKLLTAAVVIVAALALVLRSASRLARVLLPIAVALALTFLLVLLAHGAVNLFHLVSLLLVAGLAIDYSLFLSRPTDGPADRRRTLFSVSVGAASSFAMFAMLALSAIPALNAIGFTVATGILCAYTLSLLLARAEHESLQ